MPSTVFFGKGELPESRLGDLIPVLDSYRRNVDGAENK
jgi:hypothetical protein